jgi:ATP-binding cassette subfamily C protein LapB
MSTDQRQKTDPLLQCLVILTKLYHQPYSAEALTDGLPVEEGYKTPELFSIHTSKAAFSRAAKRAGFTSTLVKRTLEGIPDLVLPAILVLKGRNACILLGFNEERTHAKIILPEVGEGEAWVPVKELENEYLGYSFFIKKERRCDTKAASLSADRKEHWFWGTLYKSKKIYQDVLLGSLLINLFVLATPLFTMNVYDRVVPNSAIDTMWVLAIGIVVIYLFDTLLKFIRTYFLEIAGKKSDIIMSSLIFERVLNLKMAVRPKSVGSFANTLREFESIRSFFTSTTVATLIDLPFAVIFLLVVYFIGGIVVLAPVTIIFLILLYSFVIEVPVQRSIKSTYEANAHKNAILIESLHNLETIKTLGANGHAQWRWEEATGEIASKGLRSRMLTGSISTVTQFLVQFNTVAVLIVGVYKIDAMELTMGGLIAAVILSSRAIAPMGQFAALASQYSQTKTALESLDNIMNLPVERPEGKQFVQRFGFKGDIEFQNATFSYPDQQTPALRDLSLRIKSGERVGIIGRIGSGKTTIEKLVMGLYHPESGSVLIDGIDTNQIDPADLRNNIAYVPQDVTLFQGTLRENIVYKTPDAEDEAILEAAHIGVVDSYVNRNPKGFDMEVGERGDGLSGGQKQSIAVARAFTKECPIILLDEPSNSMDTTTEKLLIRRLRKKIEGKTTIIVTHKSSLLELVDRVIVLDDGKILLDGPKEAVLTKLASLGGGAQ